MPGQPGARALSQQDALALGKAGAALLQALRQISDLRVVGEPSANNNLDMQVLGYRIKLEELLDHAPLADLVHAAGPPTQTQLLAVAEPLREAVVLARRYANAQREALHNTLARAWQKPDFCIRRDAVGDLKDRLLTVTGSWDADWYYGKRIEDIQPAAD